MSSPSSLLPLSAAPAKSSNKRTVGHQQVSVSSDERRQFRQCLDALKLVHRQEPLEQLCDIYRQVQKEPKSELVLVHGPSGIGKDALIREFHRECRIDNALYAEGKFDQLSNSDSFAVVANACNSLCEAMMATSDESTKAAVREKISQRLGPEAVLLSQLMPAFKALSSAGSNGSSEGEEESKSEEDLASSDGEETGKISEPNRLLQRLKVLFTSFFHCLCSKTGPIFIFFNDLQWADELSLQLILSFITSQSTAPKHLLIVGAYRDDSGNEMLERYLLQRGAAESNSLGSIPIGAQSSPEDSTHDGTHAVITIRLSPLSVDAVTQVLLQISGKKETEELARAIYKKTNGNPLYLKQFLGMLHNKGTVTLNKNQEWEFDVTRILIETDSTESLGQILLSRIRELPKSVQQVLELCSFLGHQFSLDTLALVVKAVMSPEELPSPALFRDRLFTSLGEGVRAGLLERLDEQVFKFVHDSIQETIYDAMGPPTAQAKLHLRVGRILIGQDDVRDQDWKLFLAVDNLNRGSRHIQRLTEKEEVIRFNLDVARLASLKGSIYAAVEYLRRAIDLMDDHRWVRHYHLTIDVYSLAAELGQSTGDIMRSNTLMNEVQKHAKAIDDCIPVFFTEVTSAGVRGDLAGSLRLGMNLLKRLGEPFPSEPKLWDVVLEFLRTKKAIGGRSDEELIALPRMANSRKMYVMKLLNILTTQSYLIGESGKEIFAMTQLRIARLSCIHGLSSQSPIGFSVIGVLYASRGQDKLAERFGALAGRMVIAMNAQEMECRVAYMQRVFITFWRKSYAEDAAALLRAYHLGIRYCDTEFAYHCIINHLVCKYFSGQHLEVLRENFRQYISEMKECQLSMLLWIAMPFSQMVDKMAGHGSEPWSLRGDLFDYDALVQDLMNRNYAVGVYAILSSEAWLAHFFDRPEQMSFQSMMDLMNNLKAFDGLYVSITSHMNVAACCWNSFRLTRNRQYYRWGKTCLRWLQKMAKRGTGRICSPFLYVKALYCSGKFSIGSKKYKFMERTYREAISVAQSTSVPLLEGDLQGRLAQVYVDHGEQKKALQLCHSAISTMQSIGHVAKVNWLKESFANLLSESPVHRASVATLHSSHGHIDDSQRIGSDHAR